MCGEAQRGTLEEECREAWSAPAPVCLVVASAGEHMAPGVFVCPDARQGGGERGTSQGEEGMVGLPVFLGKA